jgi:hypothetical protein
VGWTNTIAFAAYQNERNLGIVGRNRRQGSREGSGNLSRESSVDSQASSIGREDSEDNVQFSDSGSDAESADDDVTETAHAQLKRDVEKLNAVFRGVGGGCGDVVTTEDLVGQGVRLQIKVDITDMSTRVARAWGVDPAQPLILEWSVLFWCLLSTATRF